ncbi:hypothetical protein I312_104489 [Cryptococcus bacillisporus CA1280]|uniref:uncharacterized protein n=1 Tax=Cryptococcus bacillisporus CA1280 TaxID=1296109 RepID=UPI0033671A08
MPDPAPFWLCHECGAQMRPVTVDGTPRCASCDGEFIEILDPEINPDPDYELPPPPPTRPGQQIPSRSDPHLFNFPYPQPEGSSSPGNQRDTNNAGNFLSNLFSMLGTGTRPGNEETPRRPPPAFPGEPSTSQRNGQTRNTDRPGVRTYSFNFGNARGSVTVGTFGANFGRQGDQPPRMNNTSTSPFGNAFNDPDPFRADPFDVRFRRPGDGDRNDNGDMPLPLGASEALQLIAAILDGNPNPNVGNLGDFATSDADFMRILQETFMEAAGPQGPVPANETVIEGLPRFTFDKDYLAKSQFRDCPVCKDDFEIGNEVMLIPCGHIYHPDCLIPWLRQSGTCPVCRFSLVSEDRQPNNQRTPNDGTEHTRNAEEERPAIPTIPAAVSNFFRNLFGGSESQPSNPPTAAEGGQGSNVSQDRHSSVNVVSQPTIPTDVSSRHSPTAMPGALQREQVQQHDEVSSEGSSNDTLIRILPEHPLDGNHEDGAIDEEARRISEQEQQAASRDRLADRVNRDFSERWQRLRREREEDDTVYHPDLD